MTTHDFGPGFPRVTLGIRRVRFYTDFLYAVRQAWRDVWGCSWFRRHQDETVDFQRLERGDWWVNECRRCGRERACASVVSRPQGLTG